MIPGPITSWLGCGAHKAGTSTWPRTWTGKPWIWPAGRIKVPIGTPGTESSESGPSGQETLKPPNEEAESFHKGFHLRSELRAFQEDLDMSRPGHGGKVRTRPKPFEDNRYNYLNLMIIYQVLLID